VSAADSGGGSWAINGLFSPMRWSSDNQIPLLFTEALVDGVPKAKISWGPWLAADRTPLLTDLLLIPRFTVVTWLSNFFGTTFIPIAYVMAGITILCSWGAVLIWLCRKLQHPRPTLLVAIVATAPFVLVNTVYIWPKILGATFVLLAFGLLVSPNSNRKPLSSNLWIVALAAAFAFLSHASNAVALVPLCLIFIRSILRQRATNIVISAAAAIVVILPWFAWQHFFQPNANSLLRFFLSGDFGFDKRDLSVWTSAWNALEHLGFSGWIAGKIANLALMLGHDDWKSFGDVAILSPAADIIGTQRVLDFSVMVRALGIAVLGLFVLPFLSDTHHGVRAAKLGAIVGLGGLMLTLAASLTMSYVHQQPYGSVLLLLFAGAVAITCLPARVGSLTASIGIAYFVVVWLIHPLLFALRIHWMALLIFFEAIAFTIIYSDSWSRRVTKNPTAKPAA
jgi:hypothetical protein